MSAPLLLTLDDDDDNLPSRPSSRAVVRLPPRAFSQPRSKAGMKAMKKAQMKEGKKDAKAARNVGRMAVDD